MMGGMSKNQPIGPDTVARVVSAIKEGWIAGDMTAQEPEALAPLAIRRWRSYARRGIAHDDYEARIRDLAKLIGLGDSKVYAPAARRIAAVLEPGSISETPFSD